jgi:hypothetical protein
VFDDHEEVSRADTWSTDQRETLFAAPMDADRMELTGPAVPLVYGVSMSGDLADFDVSTSGTLVFRRGTSFKQFMAAYSKSQAFQDLVRYSKAALEVLISKSSNTPPRS